MNLSLVSNINHCSWIPIHLQVRLGSSLNKKRKRVVIFQVNRLKSINVGATHYCQNELCVLCVQCLKLSTAISLCKKKNMFLPKIDILLFADDVKGTQFILLDVMYI